MPWAAEKQPDQARLVAMLAKECHVPLGEMTQLYAKERGAVALNAHLTNFLDIFATRRVLEQLREARSLKAATKPSEETRSAGGQG